MSIRTFSRAALLVGAVSVATTAASAGPLERRGARDVTLPAGTVLPLALDSYVAEGRVVDGIEVLPAGTPVSGFVTQARRSARVKGRARVAFRFTSMAVDDERYRVETSRRSSA